MTKLAQAIREMAHDYRHRASRARRLSRSVSGREVTERLILSARWHEATAAEMEQQVEAWESPDDPEAPRRTTACPSASQSQRGVPYQ
jgi:hypothetical protein